MTTRTKKRTCADKDRWQRLTALRQWLAAVLIESNSGRKEHLVLSHPAVASGEFAYGWSSWVNIRLRTGRDFVAGGPGPGFGLPDQIAKQIYRYESGVLRRVDSASARELRATAGEC